MDMFVVVYCKVVPWQMAVEAILLAVSSFPSSGFFVNRMLCGSQNKNLDKVGDHGLTM